MRRRPNIDFTAHLIVLYPKNHPVQVAILSKVLAFASWRTGGGLSSHTLARLDVVSVEHYWAKLFTIHEAIRAREVFLVSTMSGLAIVKLLLIVYF